MLNVNFTSHNFFRGLCVRVFKSYIIQSQHPMKFVIADIDVILLDTSRETIEFEELSVIQKRVEYLEQDQQEKISQLVSAVSPSI